jgi:translocator protein
MLDKENNMKRDLLRQFAVIFTTIYALVFNGAANAIPLNGLNTGQISDSFNVLFVPAGYVFSIWGLIYVGLLAFTIYHSLPAQRSNPLLRRVGWLAVLASIANGTWIYFWHFGYYALSLVTMLVLLVSLVSIYLRLDIGRRSFKPVERWSVAAFFSVYLGWITVATMANITDLLYFLNWDGFGIPALTWALILLVSGVLVAGIMATTRRDAAYLLVLVWAFAGISVRFINLPVMNVAGFAAAGLVLVILIASRLGSLRRSGLAAQAR